MIRPLPPTEGPVLEKKQAKRSPVRESPVKPEVVEEDTWDVNDVMTTIPVILSLKSLLSDDPLKLTNDRLGFPSLLKTKAKLQIASDILDNIGLTGEPTRVDVQRRLNELLYPLNNLEELTVKELNLILQHFKLPQKGLKAERIQRILEFVIKP